MKKQVKKMIDENLKLMKTMLKEQQSDLTELQDDYGRMKVEM